MVQFIEETGGGKGRFHDGFSPGGIYLVSSVDAQKVHRWARVTGVGPKVDGVSVGDFVLIEALMWMEGSLIDGEKFWKTDDSKILAVTDDVNECYPQR